MTRRQRRAENKRRHRAIQKQYRSGEVITYDDLIRRDRNPRVTFKARGRRVSFTARPRRRGKVPKHLRPYLFKSTRRGRR